MRKKEFEIWKLQKELERDQEITRALESSRGLGPKSRRQLQENIRSKYQSEIEREREKMKAEESWFPQGKWKPWLLMVLTLSVLGGIFREQILFIIQYILWTLLVILSEWICLLSLGNLLCEYTI